MHLEKVVWKKFLAILSKTQWIFQTLESFTPVFLLWNCMSRPLYIIEGKSSIFSTHTLNHLFTNKSTYMQTNKRMPFHIGVPSHPEKSE